MNQEVRNKQPVRSEIAEAILFIMIFTKSHNSSISIFGSIISNIHRDLTILPDL